MAKYELVLPDELDVVIAEAAAEAGVSVSEFIRRTMLDRLEDFEDIKAANEAMKAIATGEQETIPLEEVERRLGLADRFRKIG